jgi:hypothetical protein
MLYHFGENKDTNKIEIKPQRRKRKERRIKKDISSNGQK